MTKPYEETQDSQYVALQGGQYWRAAVDIPKFNIKAGTVLLLQSVRDVEGEAHTVIIRPHPSRFKRNSWDSDYRFLVQDFLRQFVLEPDYKRIRDEELAKIKGRITELQNQLAEANTNPEVMQDYVSKGVENWEKSQKLLPGSTKDLPTDVSPQATIDQALTVDKVEKMKLAMSRNKEVASLQASWITEKVEQISATAEAMMPFYKEQAAAALAMTEDVRTHVAKLMTGIESLDLYVGTNVEVSTLKKGKSADIEIPLTVMQKKLFMDEELSAWADIGAEFDFTDKKLFYKALGEEPSLVQQIFPTERCIVCVATTRRIIEYSNDPWTNAMINENNKEVFLLVRDGGNIHLVHSPIESHTKSKRLFPSQKEMSDIFVERGWNSEKTITFQDVQYTDKLSQFEMAALHYKRFLILLAGLDHRLNLFGQFYAEPKGMNFVTMRFQEAHLRFIHDDDGENLLPLVDRPDFTVWSKSKNEYLRSGSRVMCMWQDTMTPSTAPGAVKDGNDYRYYFHAEPRKKYGVAIAYREDKSICVKVPVKKSSWRSEREFEAKVDLTRFIKDRSREIGFLVLDAVKADELETYILDRSSREDFLNYIRLFKAAVNYLREEEKHETPTRAAMRQALGDGNIATGTRAEEIIDQAVIAWRSAHRGAALCKPSSAEYMKLLDQMYVLAKADQDWQLAEKFAQAEGRKPLRLVLSGKNILSLYATPLESEVDNRLWPMAWVTNIVLDRTKSGEFRAVQRRWRQLPASTATETTIYEWDEAQGWKGRLSPIEKYEDKQTFFERVEADNYNRQNTMLRPMTAAEWDDMFQRYRAMRNRMAMHNRTKYVQNPHCYVPVGLEYRKDNNRLRWVVLGTEAQVLLYKFAPDKDRKKQITDEYAGRYAQSESAKSRIVEEASKRSIRLGYMNITDKPDDFGFTGVGVAGNYDWNFNFSKVETEIPRIVRAEQKKHQIDSAPAKVFWIPRFEVNFGVQGD